MGRRFIDPISGPQTDGRSFARRKSLPFKLCIQTIVLSVTLQQQSMIGEILATNELGWTSVESPRLLMYLTKGMPRAVKLNWERLSAHQVKLGGSTRTESSREPRRDVGWFDLFGPGEHGWDIPPQFDVAPPNRTQEKKLECTGDSAQRDISGGTRVADYRAHAPKSRVVRLILWPSRLAGGEGGIRTPGATRAHVISSHAG
jgi:hypothetical protein